MNYNEIYTASLSLKEKLVRHRRTIHSFAETGFGTSKTAEYIKNVLTSLDIETHNVCENGVIGFVKANESDKAFLVRSDIDALPVKEDTGLSFASRNGCMHACGHDMHAAMLLGCAELLCKYKNQFFGKAALLFQPAEETLEGAYKVIQNGFDCKEYDGAMTLHVISPSDKETGNVVLPKGGADAPSADFFKVTIKGKGCHGSSPWLGTDPIYCACNVIASLDILKAREVSAYLPFTLTVASINSGTGFNVMPEKAEFCGSFRTFDEKVREYVKNRIQQICNSICEAYKCEYSVEYKSGCPSLYIDKELVQRFEKVLKNTIGESKVTVSDADNTTELKGSEDFAYFSREIKSFTAAIPAGYKKDEKYSSQMHSPKVMFDEDALAVGCSVFTACTLDFLKDGQ